MAIVSELEQQLDVISVLEHWGIDTSYIRQIGAGEYRSPCFIHGGDGQTALSLKMNNGRWYVACFSHGCFKGTLFDWAITTGRTPRQILDDYKMCQLDTVPLHRHRTRRTHTQGSQKGGAVFLPDNTMEQFEIGIHRDLIDLGYDRDMLTNVFDVRYCADAEHVLYGRIVYPIRDKLENIRTIQGRRTNALPHDAAKYMFHPGYNAKDILYGQYEMREMIRKSRYIVVAESPKSAWRGYQLGIPTLALMGIRWTDAQVKQIAAYGKRVVLVADNDDTHVGVNGMRELRDALSRYVAVELRVCPHVGADISDYRIREQWDYIIRNGVVG
ncbi:hypothetical protein [Alicyclobacillus acidoterrestris]|uniref:Uncharacterized protein n=1 Tax=Alicyclobacillus acidoterrestris (strain ATCC 49025 / DSM 3922 / CIP 106132 / NCIMB 13137 / GD3B) TaxID=1356854 RepID=T0C424_ALIAG|nr:hypothetical protein [Alicyclobacillus acidoterrestris]EPZ47764.1 hypothetical protein N007_05785 [Alicyclobacillus acidoterrestris ATCC 49025]UNO47933.1 hypothetical protein K1I37_14755 [Alicyclobacillus acidoterrestris]